MINTPIQILKKQIRNIKLLSNENTKTDKGYITIHNTFNRNTNNYNEQFKNIILAKKNEIQTLEFINKLLTESDSLYDIKKALKNGYFNRNKDIFNYVYNIIEHDIKKIISFNEMMNLESKQDIKDLYNIKEQFKKVNNDKSYYGGHTEIFKL